MLSTQLLERKDVDERLTWDLSGIFKTEKEYEEAVEEAQKTRKRVGRRV